jgi:hypothetical protein
MATKTKITDWNGPRVALHTDFGVKDHKGRAIGAFITKGTNEFVALKKGDNEMSFWTDKEPGVYFYFRPQNTRNGKSYGACQSRQYFNTEAECDAAIAKYLEAAKKRFSKKAA